MKEFETKEDAIDWMINEISDPCIDNIRFAFLDDEKEKNAYKQKQNSGCCGYFDQEVKVAGRKATVGCNFGH